MVEYVGGTVKENKRIWLAISFLELDEPMRLPDSEKNSGSRADRVHTARLEVGGAAGSGHALCDGDEELAVRADTLRVRSVCCGKVSEK